MVDPAFTEVSRTWTRLGGENPMWAVLTDGSTWDSGEFLATGRQEIADVLARLDALGVAPVRGRAVDFGCGAGRLCGGLAHAGFAEVIGLDVSPTMLATAGELVGDAGCEFRLVEGDDLAAVESDSADLVYSCRVLQHMPPRLAHGYVRELYRIARPGGVVVFQLPTTPAPGLAGAAVRLLPPALITRLRRGMQMHGTPQQTVEALVASAGARLVSADPDTSAGPRWSSRLYVTVAP